VAVMNPATATAKPIAWETDGTLSGMPVSPLLRSMLWESI